MSDEQRLDLKAAAERSGKSVTFLRSHIRAGRLQAIKIDRKFYLEVEGFDAAIAALPVAQTQADLDQRIQEIVDAAPPLKEEQRRQLRMSLPPRRFSTRSH